MSHAHGLRMPSSIVVDRTFSLGQLCRDLDILCRDRNSRYLGQLYHNIDLLCHDIISPCLDQLCCDLKILCRNRKSSQLGQLCRDIELLSRDIELLSRNTKPLHFATLYRDIKTFRCDRKLIAWPTLSRQRNHGLANFVTTQLCGFLSRHYNLYRDPKSLGLHQAPIATLTSCLGFNSRDKGTFVATLS